VLHHDEWKMFTDLSKDRTALLRIKQSMKAV